MCRAEYLSNLWIVFNWSVPVAMLLSCMLCTGIVVSLVWVQHLLQAISSLPSHVSWMSPLSSVSKGYISIKSESNLKKIVCIHTYQTRAQATKIQQKKWWTPVYTRCTNKKGACLMVRDLHQDLNRQDRKLLFIGRNN